MAKLKEHLSRRLSEVQNPEWYLHILGSAFEESQGDPDRAIAVADKMYDEQPQPPANKADRAIQAIADDMAADDYAASITEPDDFTTIITSDTKSLLP